MSEELKLEWKQKLSGIENEIFRLIGKIEKKRLHEKEQILKLTNILSGIEQKKFMIDEGDQLTPSQIEDFRREIAEI